MSGLAGLSRQDVQVRKAGERSRGWTPCRQVPADQSWCHCRPGLDRHAAELRDQVARRQDRGRVAQHQGGPAARGAVRRSARLRAPGPSGESSQDGGAAVKLQRVCSSLARDAVGPAKQVKYMTRICVTVSMLAIAMCSWAAALPTDPELTVAQIVE